jgi:mono/diheme cytochrome c family protein
MLMKSRWILIILGVFGLAATLCYGALPRQAGKKTVADGVYTSAQADRGYQIVLDYGCTNCHGAQFEGGAEEQPQLLGDEFVNAWSGRKLDELAEKITTMPADQPPQYHVKPAAAPDVIAFILRVNGYLEGSTELSADPKVLKEIEIVAP